MTKYRKKMPIIEAVQWKGKMQEVIDFVGHDLPTYGRPGQDGSLRVNDMECRMGDWIIKGHRGEFYAFPGDVFKATYDEVVEP